MMKSYIQNCDDERDSDAWLECVKQGVRPLKMSCVPFSDHGWLCSFRYKFDPAKSKSAAFTYLKSVFCARDLEAFQRKDQSANEFFVRFNVNYRKMATDGRFEPC